MEDRYHFPPFLVGTSSFLVHDDVTKVVFSWAEIVFFLYYCAFISKHIQNYATLKLLHSTQFAVVVVPRLTVINMHEMNTLEQNNLKKTCIYKYMQVK
jgi:hypothetical protein